MTKGRWWRRAALLLGLAAAGAAPAAAQGFPDRPLQIVMPLPPGSGTDILARVFATEFAQALGGRAVVTNRTGASLTIGMAAVANAPADGYTLAFSPVTPVVVQPHRVRNLGYTRDSFTPVCQTFDNIFHVAVPPTSPFRDFASLLAFARANPGRLQYGHTGPASGPHLAGAQLWRAAGAELTDVPYRGEADFAANLLAGTLDIGMATTFLVQSQGLRSLAVIGDTRLPGMPGVPTVGELGFGAVRSVTYGGLFVRAGTPAPILAQLEDACRRAVASPAYVEMAERQVVRASHADSSAFAARMAGDDVAVAALVRLLRLEE